MKNKIILLTLALLFTLTVPVHAGPYLPFYPYISEINPADGYFEIAVPYATTLTFAVYVDCPEFNDERTVEWYHNVPLRAGKNALFTSIFHDLSGRVEFGTLCGPPYSGEPWMYPVKFNINDIPDDQALLAMYTYDGLTWEYTIGNPSPEWVMIKSK